MSKLVILAKTPTQGLLPPITYI